MDQQQRLKYLQGLLKKIQGSGENAPEKQDEYLGAASRAINRMLKANEATHQEIRQLLGKVHLSQAMVNHILEGNGNTDPE